MFRKHNFLLLLFCLGVTNAAAFANHPIRNVLPENLGKYWVLADRQISADVPNSGRHLNDPGCAAVSYVIEKNGTTSHIKLERVVPDSDLGKVAVSIAAGLHYRSTSENAARDPVFTYLVVPFNLPEATLMIAGDKARVDAERAAIVQACKIEDFSS